MLRRVAPLLASCALSLAVAQAQPQRETPYMASIASGRAMMRTGPGQNYPGTWLYVRRDLPIRVVRVYREWREIVDELRESRDEASAVRFRAEPNVVGRVSRCTNGWCYFDVRGRGGYIRVDRLWGVGANEVVR